MIYFAKPGKRARASFSDSLPLAVGEGLDGGGGLAAELVLEEVPVAILVDVFLGTPELHKGGIIMQLVLDRILSPVRKSVKVRSLPTFPIKYCRYSYHSKLVSYQFY